MKQIFVMVLLVTFSIATAGADEALDRAKLSGTWQLGTDKEGATWVLEEKPDDIHVTYLEGDHKLAEFECNTMSRECEMKESGKSAKVSIWFSGAKLVVLETKGQEVVKRRFSVADSGDALDLEVIPILPGGKTETLHLKRVQR